MPQSGQYQSQQQQQPPQQRMVTPMMSQVPVNPMMSQVPVNPMTQQQPVNTMTTQQQFMSGHPQISGSWLYPVCGTCGCTICCELGNCWEL
jgi:hypothetical protein